jgi:hypothetical protein
MVITVTTSVRLSPHGKIYFFAGDSIKVYQKLRSRFEYNVGLEQIDTLMANHIKPCIDQIQKVKIDKSQHGYSV